MAIDFGEIAGGKMELSEIGMIVKNFWYEIPQHFRNVKLDSFIVMPDHLNGIIIINNTDKTNPDKTTTKTNMEHKQQKWKSGTLGVIINQYKRICTINVRIFFPDFAWQPRYYDYIIHDEITFKKIAGYIQNNRGNWQG